MPKKTSSKPAAKKATGVKATPVASRPKGATAAPAQRFVLLSDLHAHPWTAFAKGDGAQNSRLLRSMAVLDASLAKAQSLGVPWVFAGDIVHTAGYTQNVVLAALTAVLAKYPDLWKIAVWGNHDARGIGGLITIEQTVFATLRHAVPRLVVLDTAGGPATLYKDVSGLTFSGAGYQPRGELLQYAPPSDVGVYHQTIRGTKTSNGFELEEGIDPKELLKRHRIVVVGHVHHWQHIGHPVGKMLLIPGAPEHHNFGDVGDHGWWIIDAGAQPTAIMVPGGSPQFLTVDSPADVSRKSPHFYRVRSTAAGEVLPEGVAAIAPGPTTVESRDVLRGARGDQILQAWMKESPPLEGADIKRYLDVGRELLGTQDTQNLRDLRITGVRLENFCSYEDQVVNVQPGTWLVLGRGKDYPSNGAGKSSLFESVYWAVFGKTTKGLSGDEVIRWGAEQCAVTVTFAGPNDEWLSVRRTRGKSSVLQVGTQDGPFEAKSVTEMTDKLTQYIGITPELYQALGYFSQERLLLFAAATDGERKEMLADLIGLTSYQAASSEAQQRATAFEVESLRLTTMHGTAKTQVASEQARLTEVLEQASVWDDQHAESIAQAEAAVAQFDAAKPQEQARLTQTAMGRAELALEERAGTAEGQQLVARTHLLDLADKPTATTKVLNAAMEKKYAAASTLRRILDSHTAVLRQLSAANERVANEEVTLAEGMCPSCDQPITLEHAERCLAPARAEVARLEAEAEEWLAQQEPARIALAKWEERVTDMAAGVDAQAERDKWEQALASATAALEDIERLRGEMAASARVQVESTLKTQRAGLVRTADEVRSRVNPYTAERNATAERLGKARKDVAQYTAEQAKCAVELSVLEYWRKGFSKQGIQSLLVDEVAVLFNQERGTIFPALTQGVYDVQFSTVSQTRAGEMRERTEFHIYEHGQLVPYSALSGGQRRRVDVGVMLTLVKGVSRWMQVPGVLGLLVLDEVFGFLDGSGAEGLVEALREVQTQIPAIFVVAHDPQLQALFPEAIVVEQGQDGISRIRTEA